MRNVKRSPIYRRALASVPAGTVSELYAAGLKLGRMYGSSWACRPGNYYYGATTNFRAYAVTTTTDRAARAYFLGAARGCRIPRS